MGIWGGQIPVQAFKIRDGIQACPDTTPGKHMAAIGGIDPEVRHHNGLATKIEGIEECGGRHRGHQPGLTQQLGERSVVELQIAGRMAQTLLKGLTDVQVNAVEGGLIGSHAGFDQDLPVRGASRQVRQDSHHLSPFLWCRWHHDLLGKDESTLPLLMGANILRGLELSAHAGQNRALVGKGCAGEHGLEGIPVSLAAQPDEVVAEPPADALHEFLKDNAVETTEQQRTFVDGQQAEGQPEIADFASGQEHPDGVEIAQPGFCEQPSEVQSP